MYRRSGFLVLWGLLLILLNGCTTVPTGWQTSSPEPTHPPAMARLLSTVPIPATCTPTPVYLEGSPRDPGVPWIAAAPASSGITGTLFFAFLTSAQQPQANSYQPMHTSGKMPDGATTKILWNAQKRTTIGDLVLIGKNLSPPGETFQQTFPQISGGDIPSIVDMPAPGCWQFDLHIGSSQATATFWVLP